MTKITVLNRFRSKDCTTIYEVGETHDFEDARAQSLALRGLVRIETPKVEKQTVEEPKDTEEPKAKRRKVKEEE